MLADHSTLTLHKCAARDSLQRTEQRRGYPGRDVDKHKKPGWNSCSLFCTGAGASSSTTEVATVRTGGLHTASCVGRERSQISLVATVQAHGSSSRQEICEGHPVGENWRRFGPSAGHGHRYLLEPDDTIFKVVRSRRGTSSTGGGLGVHGFPP